MLLVEFPFAETVAMEECAPGKGAHVMDTARIVIASLIAALAATNTAWLLLYNSRGSSTPNVPVAVGDGCGDRVRELERLVDDLTRRVKELDDNNTKLILQYNQLVEKYNRLVDYVRAANETLRRNLALLKVLGELNRSLTMLHDYSMLHAYYSPRVRSLFQPAGLGDLVASVTGSPAYVAGRAGEHLRKLYSWVVENVEEAPDQVFPAIKTLEYINVSGRLYVAGIVVDFVDNYIQSPTETLKRGAGDCEDQAILLASLYKSYLGDAGDAWVVCLLTNVTDHCLALAYDKARKSFVLADPVYEFYSEGKSVESLIQQWEAYMGLRSVDISRVILFNNSAYVEGSLAEALAKLPGQGEAG